MKLEVSDTRPKRIVKTLLTLMESSIIEKPEQLNSGLNSGVISASPEKDQRNEIAEEYERILARLYSFLKSFSIQWLMQKNNKEFAGPFFLPAYITIETIHRATRDIVQTSLGKLITFPNENDKVENIVDLGRVDFAFNLFSRFFKSRIIRQFTVTCENISNLAEQQFMRECLDVIGNDCLHPEVYFRRTEKWVTESSEKSYSIGSPELKFFTLLMMTRHWPSKHDTPDYNHEHHAKMFLELPRNDKNFVCDTLEYIIKACIAPEPFIAPKQND